MKNKEETKDKSLGVRVSSEVHKLAHMTARSEGLSLSEWLTNLINNQVKFFLANDVQSKEQLVR